MIIDNTSCVAVHDDRIQRRHFERDVILGGVRWYVANPISYRQL